MTVDNLETTGSTRGEKYNEILVELQTETPNRKNIIEALNLMTIDLFPATARIIAKHQLICWRHPADLASSLGYLIRNSTYRVDIPNTSQIQPTIPRPAGMSEKNYKRLCLSVGSVLRRRIDWLLIYPPLEGADPSKLSEMDERLAVKIEEAYNLIYDERG